MLELPGGLFIIDSTKEDIAIHEAQKLGIPIVAVVDTNGDPENIDYAIPGNDDAVRAIELFASKISEAVLEGKKKLIEKELQEEKKEEEPAVEGAQEAVEEAPEAVQEKAPPAQEEPVESETPEVPEEPQDSEPSEKE